MPISISLRLKKEMNMNVVCTSKYVGATNGPLKVILKKIEKIVLQFLFQFYVNYQNEK